jgi:hypothetical protein
MYTVVGRFRFRPIGQDAMNSMMQGIAQDFAPIARECSGFRAVYFSRPSDDEVMTTWLWDHEADWGAAQARFGPYLAQHVIPHLAGPPDRVGAEVDVQITP